MEDTPVRLHAALKLFMTFAVCAAAVGAATEFWISLAEVMTWMAKEGM